MSVTICRQDNSKEMTKRKQAIRDMSANRWGTRGSCRGDHHPNTQKGWHRNRQMGKADKGRQGQHPPYVTNRRDTTTNDLVQQFSSGLQPSLIYHSMPIITEFAGPLSINQDIVTFWHRHGPRIQTTTKYPSVSLDRQHQVP